MKKCLVVVLECLFIGLIFAGGLIIGSQYPENHWYYGCAFLVLTVSLLLIVFKICLGKPIKKGK